MWAAASPAVDGERVLAAIASGADVRRVTRVAVRQRIGPLLYRALQSIGRLDAAGDALPILRADHELRRLQALMLIPDAVRLSVEPLRAAGLTPVVLKGPSMSMRYPTPNLRPMDDLDLFLPRRDYDAGFAALRSAGWTAIDRIGEHHDLILTHRSVPHFALELHRGIDTWRERSALLRPKVLWSSRVPFDCFGQPAYRLDPVTELVALAAHAGKPFHQFHRLIWSVDIAVLAGAEPAGLDWDRVAALAHTAGATTAVAVALVHARRLGADVPTFELPRGRLRSAVIAPLETEGWPLLETTPALDHQLRYAIPDRLRCRAMLAAGEIAEGGPTKVPARAAELLGRTVRRVWRWRGGRPLVGLDDPMLGNARTTDHL
jgi:hypothetical protein